MSGHTRAGRADSVVSARGFAWRGATLALLALWGCGSDDRVVERAWEGFLNDAVEYLRGRQARLRSDFDLGQWDRYDYDQDTGTLTFSSGGRIGVVADIQIVGSTSKTTGTWLWAWDNPSVLESVKHCVDDVRAHGQKHGFAKLTTPKWTGDERDGWEMAAVAAYLLKAEGAYRAADELGVLFMVLRNVRRSDRAR